MSKTISEITTSLDNDSPTATTNMPNRDDAGYSRKDRQKSNIFIETFTNRIDPKNSPQGKVASTARALGFALCDPDYNREGALPKPGEHHRTEVECDVPSENH